MKKYILAIIIMFSWLTNVNAKYDKLAYDFTFVGIEGKKISLNDYRDKVILIVNVASRCGFTYQYEGLQSLWTKYKNNDLVVIGIPSDNFKQEPGNNKDIKEFCETNFSIDFPITEKTNVIGKDAHIFFKWARKNHGLSAIPKWNFHKILINKRGKISKTFTSITKPTSNKFIDIIEQEINN